MWLALVEDVQGCAFERGVYSVHVSKDAVHFSGAISLVQGACRPAKCSGSVQTRAGIDCLPSERPGKGARSCRSWCEVLGDVAETVGWHFDNTLRITTEQLSSVCCSFRQSLHLEEGRQLFL